MSEKSRFYNQGRIDAAKGEYDPPGGGLVDILSTALTFGLLNTSQSEIDDYEEGHADKEREIKNSEK